MTQSGEKLRRLLGPGQQDNRRVIDVGSPAPGTILINFIDALSGNVSDRVKSVEDKILDHFLDRQRFSLRFLSIIVLPAVFLVGVNKSDEKIRTSCFAMVSLIVGALIQESGSQRNPRFQKEERE